MKIVDLDALTAEDLRHLAAAKALGDSRCIRDPAAAAADLAERGVVRTIGWWRRHTTRPAPTPAGQPSIRTLARVAAGMVRAGLPELVVARAVVDMAVEDGLQRDLAERAAARGIVEARRHHPRRRRVA
jgi:hypothetical protein